MFYASYMLKTLLFPKNAKFIEIWLFGHWPSNDANGTLHRINKVK